MTASAMPTKLPHPFELRGLGISPFSYVGVTENRFDLGNGESKPGGTCDYCGNGILYEFHCQSADGKRFHVGCDCVGKLDRDSNKAYGHDKALVAILRAANALKTEKRHTREAAAIEAGKAAVLARAADLAKLPHPSKWRADKGETALDSFNWYMTSAGNKGKLGAIQWAKQILGI